MTAYTDLPQAAKLVTHIKTVKNCNTGLWRSIGGINSCHNLHPVQAGWLCWSRVAEFFGPWVQVLYHSRIEKKQTYKSLEIVSQLRQLNKLHCVKKLDAWGTT